MMRATPILGVLAALAFAAPAAATQHAAPGGSATAAACPQAAPCALQRALAVSVPGEEIVLAPGDYHVDSSAATGCTGARAAIQPGAVALHVNNRYVHGVAGWPRPRIIGSARACTAVAVDAAGRLQHVEVHGSNTTQPEGYALLVDGAGVALDVITGGANGAVQVRNVAHIYDSVVRSRADGVGVLAYFGSNHNVAGSSSVLTNVTVLGRVVAASPADTATKVDIQCLNSIATGGYRLENRAPASATVQRITMTLNRCLGAFSTDGGPNEAFDAILGTPPGTLRLAPDGYHQLPGSNSIDTGLTLTDATFLFSPEIDGGPRNVGAGPDIGADEFGSARPIVDSGAVRSTAGATAVVAGTVTPGGVPAGAYVEYGPGPGYGSRTPVTPIAGGFGAVPVTFTLTGMTANAPYHYRIVAGAVPGQDRVLRFPDADADGFFANADCDDADPAIHPGAPDAAGNGVDEDCSGADQPAPPPPAPAPPTPPTPRVTATVSAGWVILRGRTTITRLLVRGVPDGGRVEVRCRGKRCPFKRKRASAPKRGRVNALKALGKRRTLRAGQTLEVRITQPGSIGRVVRWNMRAGKRQPKLTSPLCLPPGGDRPQRRC